MNKHKVKHHRKSDTNTGNRDHIRTTALERSVMNYWGLKLVLRRQPHLKNVHDLPEHTLLQSIRNSLRGKGYADTFG